MISKNLNEGIVISGISGVFPKCDNVSELAEKLYSKEYLVTPCDIQWENELQDMPRYLGAINTLSKFDATFFGIRPATANSLNPDMRLLLEKTFEAIIDSGTNPHTLRGSNTGVYVGMCLPTHTSMRFHNTSASDESNSIQSTELGNHIYANMISYNYDLKGPSISMDTACSSSLCALAEALKAIKNGECDTAIVATANIWTYPKEYNELGSSSRGLWAKDGKCKSFDESGDGFVNSETVCVMLLQKSSEANRVYAKIVNAMSNNDGFKMEGQPHPSRKMQASLLSKFYANTAISPNEISWVETHGTGTTAGDQAEAGSLDDVLCKAREKPLLIGAVKSNLGHTDGSAGLVGITKVLIAMENEVIPSNLHYKTPRSDIESLVQGRIKVIEEHLKWDGGYVGVNSFGIGGVNCHVLLKSNDKLKIKNSNKLHDLPITVFVSGRTEEAVDNILSHLEKKIDFEQVRLIQEIHQQNIQGHLYRGYVVLGSEKNTTKHIQRYSELEREVWFVFSGMGSQWPGMAKDMMRLPVFAKSIRKLHDILKPLGIDLIQIIVEESEKIFTSLLNCFVGITAMQIALVDVLEILDIKPDRIIGHSFGEIACAYADGCLTAEQAILCSYYRGKCTTETENITGLMASIGLGFNDVKRLLPDGVVVACHNSSTNCTISGPKKEVEGFLEVLRAREIFVQEVYTEQIAYHSKHINEASLYYLHCMQKIIPTYFKERTSRWISTSIPQVDWDKESSKYCSAEYFTNNLVSSVLFEEASSLIPENALLIEISPHGILHPILRRSLNENAITIPLMTKNQKNSLVHMLTSVGRLYEEGIHPKIHKLYPPVEFPVSKGTPMISPLVKWEHSDDWFVYKYKFECNGVRDVKISLKDKKYKYLEDHVVEGRNLFPAAGYLILVWETFAWMNNRGDYKKFPIVFENVKFSRAAILPKKGELTLRITIQSSETGYFEVSERGVLCVEGRIMEYKPNECDEDLPCEHSSDSLDIPTNDIYKEFQIFGFEYKGLFRGLLGMNIEGSRGQIQWNDNYVTFLDNILQSTMIGKCERLILVPTSIRKLVIDSEKQNKLLKINTALPVGVSHKKDIIRCGGVQVINMTVTKVDRQQATSKEPVLRKYQFTPFMDETEHSLGMAVEVAFNLIVDSLNSSHFKIIEILNENSESDEITSNILYKYTNDWLNIQPEITIFSEMEHEELHEGIKVQKGSPPSKLNAFLIIMHDIQSNTSHNLRDVLSNMVEGSYLLCVECAETQLDLKYTDAVCCMNYKCDGNRLILLRKKTSNGIRVQPIVIKIEIDDYAWITRLQDAIKAIEEGENKILIYSQDDRSGILGFYKCLKREITTEKIRCFFIQDNNAPPFSLEEKCYSEQLEKGCPLNIYKNGEWGTYSHLQMQIAETTPVEHAYVDILKIGDLSSLKWIPFTFEGNSRIDLNGNIHEVLTINYVSLNFRDVMLATGCLPEISGIAPSEIQNCMIGYECVGTFKDGRRFIGMCNGGGFSTDMSTEHIINLVEIPKSWSLEDAATVGIVYLTAIAGLIARGNIKKGESILIHSATGGVGQAAINIATFYECEIYVTVGTPEKREFIRKHFPQIPEDNIGNSRDTSFETMIQERTNGYGVNMVLNSLAGEKLVASVRCLAPNGRFIEMGKSDIAKDNPLGMRVFRKGITFHGINNIITCTDINEFIKNKLVEGLNQGWVKPLMRKVYERHEFEEAFRFMASGKHIGKILIKMRDDNDGKISRTPFYVNAIPRYLCHTERSHIICGGLGGFGLELTLWLASRGAKNIIVSSRNGIKSNYQRFIMEKWKRTGTRVVISTDDITTEEGTKRLIEKANQLGPVSAIFNVAVVLQDALYENQTVETFGTVVGAKILGTSHLDHLSRSMCPSLEQFVVFSSVACGVGTYGQTNYGWANSAAERICEKRRCLGLPGLAIQWGAIGDVGIVAEMMQEDPNYLISSSAIAQSIRSCLEALDKFLCEQETVVSSWISVDKEMCKSNGNVSLVDRILGILGMKDLKNVSMQASLAQSGLDSFSSNELRQILEMDYDIVLSISQVRSLTFANILEMSSKKPQASEDFSLSTTNEHLET